MVCDSCQSKVKKVIVPDKWKEGSRNAVVKAGKTNRLAILDYINKTSYKGVGQTLKFDAKGEPATKVMNEFIVKNGKIEYVGAIK
jgi:hypothetical protein